MSSAGEVIGLTQGAIYLNCLHLQNLKHINIDFEKCDITSSSKHIKENEARNCLIVTPSLSVNHATSICHADLKSNLN
jgi:hypothetical protein